MNASNRLSKLLDDALTAARGAHEPALAKEIALEGGERLMLSLSAVDAFACLVEEIVLRTPKLAGASSERLREIGEKLSSKLTYLLEPIRLIETDGEAGQAQLRSSPPHKNDGVAAWYEILVRRGGEIELCRFRREAGQGRQRVAAQLTREVVTRLCEDLVYSSRGT
jgi:hypothetical protein